MNNYGYTGPELINVKDARNRIGAPQHAFNKLYPHLHILRLPHQSRRFAVPYLDAVDLILSGIGGRQYAGKLISFATSPEGQQIIDDTEASFDEAIRPLFQPVAPPHLPPNEAGNAISVQDAAAAINIKLSTINDWENSREMSTFKVGRFHYVHEAVFRQALHWERPYIGI